MEICGVENTDGWLATLVVGGVLSVMLGVGVAVGNWISSFERRRTIVYRAHRRPSVVEEDGDARAE